MKNYNKLPSKERKRQMEYSYKQTERQEELAFKKMCKQAERDKMNAMRDNERLDDSDDDDLDWSDNE